MIDKIKKYLVEEVGQDKETAVYYCERLAGHEDLVKEYCNWIDSHDFACENPVTVEEWTAQKLHECFPGLDDLTIFITLQELRDDPVSAHDSFEGGFAIM